MITTILCIAMAPFALFGMFCLIALVLDSGIITLPAKKETSEDRIKRYGYDPNSSMVQHFQKLAGIDTNRKKWVLL